MHRRSPRRRHRHRARDPARHPARRLLGARLRHEHDGAPRGRARRTWSTAPTRPG
ncbi:hypothetical protein [Curtobacterium sp. MCJR17_043]|uniref:hypothetical protein n=1 Tax=Curtobacterium sp. MCJR17_043 TaxID=2175660 RepID=UPI0024E02454|nr:hypothetical protein [Curtobacterium sp. MCJR17_043]WIB34793.1 hypothetical protein DEJ15_09440 [Curtobacterium sp. MCJR17_043]